MRCSVVHCIAVRCSSYAVEQPFLQHFTQQRTTHHHTHTTNTYSLTHHSPLKGCLRERDSLSDKLKMTDSGHLDRVSQSDLEDTSNRRGDAGYTGDLTVEQAYEDLKAEYKVKAMHV